MPANLEVCVERRYFSELHYLALVCDDDVLIQRLRQRPAWRHSDTPEYLSEQLAFNRWFKTQAGLGTPAVEVIDTTRRAIAATVEQVAAWIRATLRP